MSAALGTTTALEERQRNEDRSELVQRIKAATAGSCLVALTVTPLEVVKVRMQTGNTAARSAASASTSGSSAASTSGSTTNTAGGSTGGVGRGVNESRSSLKNEAAFPNPNRATDIGGSGTTGGAVSSSSSSSSGAPSSAPSASSATVSGSTSFTGRRSVSSRLVSLSDGIRDHLVRVPSSSLTSATNGNGPASISSAATPARAAGLMGAMVPGREALANVAGHGGAPPAASSSTAAAACVAAPASAAALGHVQHSFLGNSAGAASSSSSTFPVVFAASGVGVSGGAVASTRGGSRGIMGTLRHVVRTEGLSALYRPVWPTLLMSVPQNVLYFVTFDTLKESLDDVTGRSTPPSSISNSPKEVKMKEIVVNSKYRVDTAGTSNSSTTSADLVSGGANSAVAGVCARAVTVVCTSPFEIVRTRLGTARNTSLWKTVQELHLSAGVKGYYRGLRPSLLRDVPFSAFYWASYDILKNTIERSWGHIEDHAPSSLSAVGGAPDRHPQPSSGSTAAACCSTFSSSSASSQSTSSSSSPAPPSFRTAFVSGAIAGSIATVFSHPFDVVKTQWQVDTGKGSGTSVFTALNTLRKQGQCFSGLAPRMLRVTPACAIMITAYEYAKR
ncbi:unnamed protein product [Amoebophrya sp. A25]|nr:unnamed protein product [Amoebophrya sp. A25]|eukprot:GSA25T00014195001.1